jgi:hypothetical protein
MALSYNFIGAFHFSSYATRSFITFHKTVYVTTKRIKCRIHTNTHRFYVKHTSYDLQLNIYKEKGPRVFQSSKHFGRPTAKEPIQILSFRKHIVHTVCRKARATLKRKQSYDICSTAEFEHLYEY